MLSSLFNDAYMTLKTILTLIQVTLSNYFLSLKKKESGFYSKSPPHYQFQTKLKLKIKQVWQVQSFQNILFLSAKNFVFSCWNKKVMFTERNLTKQKIYRRNIIYPKLLFFTMFYLELHFRAITRCKNLFSSWLFCFLIISIK